MKERHPLDIISLIFGVLFLGLAVPVLLLDTPLDVETRWALPILVIIVGLVVLGSSLLPNRKLAGGADEPAGEDL
jgi:hypothetical protein